MKRPIATAPATLFDLAPFELEHKPSIDRQERIQTASLAERQDTALHPDVRRLHLERARRYIDRLVEELEEASG